MKVAMWYSNNDIRIEEVPTPQPGKNEMIVKVDSCGICGSDVVEWYRLPHAPLVQGHEIGAKVVKTGSAVAKYKTGDRVFIAPKVPCMECYYCRNGHYPQCSEAKERLPGGFAEYILVPEIILNKGTYLLPDNVTYEQSTFIEPLACAVRAQRSAGLKKNRTILVLGCGMSGLIHIKLGVARNCKVIATDINPKRLKFAEKIGANSTIDATKNVSKHLIEKTGRLADIVILCTSAMSAITQAWESVDKGGVVVVFAVTGPDKSVTIPLNDFWTKEIKTITSYYCGPPDISEAIELIESKKILTDDMITHRLPLHEIEKGFRLVSEGLDSIKVIIKPDQNLQNEERGHKKF